MKYQIGEEADNFCKEFVWRGEQIEKLEIINTELLEALQNLLAVARPHSSDDGIWPVAIGQAEQAITKATE